MATMNNTFVSQMFTSCFFENPDFETIITDVNMESSGLGFFTTILSQSEPTDKICTPRKVERSDDSRFLVINCAMNVVKARLPVCSRWWMFGGDPGLSAFFGALRIVRDPYEILRSLSESFEVLWSHMRRRLSYYLSRFVLWGKQHFPNSVLSVNRHLL